MSLRFEQQRALHKTREFLRELLTVEGYPKTKKGMRERAYRCLKHFPALDSRGAPIWSRDDMECPVIEKPDEYWKLRQ